MKPSLYSSTRGFFKSASVLCGPSPIRVNESVDSIETELSTLFNSENESPEIIKANETFQLKKEMLTNHGYSLSESADYAILTGSKDGRNFTITWKPDYVASQTGEEDHGDYNQEDYQDENDRESDEEVDMGELEGQLSGDEYQGDNQSQFCEVEVKIDKGEGKTLYLQCATNPEGNLLLFRMGPNEDSLVIVSELMEEVQHKVYDYLDELGVGDGIANFINEYNEYRSLKKHCDTVRYVADFFSKE